MRTYAGSSEHFEMISHIRMIEADLTWPTTKYCTVEVYEAVTSLSG